MFTPVESALSRASPSLALMKYWGKADSVRNLPATPSLALTLSGLISETRAWAIPDPRAADIVFLDTKLQNPERFAAFFDELRSQLGTTYHFWAQSTNNFPTAAGLASSSSGFAALTTACAAACGSKATSSSLSAIARRGSGSAARSFFGGFSVLPTGAEEAHQIYPASFWPELRVIVVRIHDGPKETGSRDGMELTRETSPYYKAWLDDAAGAFPLALEALTTRDLSKLGPFIRRSYLRMFATMLGAEPPLLYWRPDSLAAIALCDQLRKQGAQAWETMDAGPQVKVFTTEHDLQVVLDAFRSQLPDLGIYVDKAGEGPVTLKKPALRESIHPILQEKASALGLALDVL